MIYDLLVSPPTENGLGLRQGFPDLDAFRAAGRRWPWRSPALLSILQDRTTSAKDLILEILRHS
jgi:hypothetical protein